MKIQAILSPVLQLLVSTGVLIVVVVSAMYYQSGELTMPELITLLMYGMLFARPMSTLANLYGQTQQAIGSSTRLNNVFKLSPEPDSYVNESKTEATNQTLNTIKELYRLNRSILIMRQTNLCLIISISIFNQNK